MIETPPEVAARSAPRRPLGRTAGGTGDQAGDQPQGARSSLHNRVESPTRAAESLRALVPGVRIQVPTARWRIRSSRVAMLNFLRGDADCPGRHHDHRVGD